MTFLGRVCEYTKVESEAERRLRLVNDDKPVLDERYEATRAKIIEVMNTLPPNGACRWTAVTFKAALRDAGVFNYKCTEALVRLLDDHNVAYDPAAAYRKLLTTIYESGMRQRDVLAALTAAGRKPKASSICRDLREFGLRKPRIHVNVDRQLLAACRAAVADGALTPDAVFERVVASGVNANYVNVFGLIKRHRLIRLRKHRARSVVRLTIDEVKLCESLVNDKRRGKRATALLRMNAGEQHLAVAKVIGMSPATVSMFALSANVNGVTDVLEHGSTYGYAVRKGKINKKTVNQDEDN